MRKIVAALIALIVIPVLTHGQTTVGKVADDAFMITRMVNKFHVEPRPVDAVFSGYVFNTMLERTDADRLLFTKSDLDRLNSYYNTLDKEITQRKTGYISTFTVMYERGLKQTDSIVKLIAQKPIDFYAPEKLTVTEDTSRPASAAARQLKIYKKIKEEVLDDLVGSLPVNFKSFSLQKQKKYIDSAKVPLIKKVTAFHERRMENILQNPYGITQYVGNIYCEVIASCFDPHTEFFPPEEKENFESELGKQPFMFGFTVVDDKSGGVLIDDLQPGSPAFKGGKLNKGDKFMALQWEGAKQIDVSDMSSEELSSILAESNHKKMLFTMKKKDGTTTQVSLEKEQVADESEGDRINSFVLKSAKNAVGYIYLPDFYEDWDTKNDGLNGCANDVGREILRLKKANINGLILDLRNNGGGSVGEATELAGIFIDAGPVGQEKGREPKPFTLKDIDPGTVYDGPLVILVNGSSASASELVAGTLQDYHRAVIIGSPTFGKATAQVILPMDTGVTPENADKIHTADYLKITVSKLYRVTGATAQFSGVQPDIVLPDAIDAFTPRESDDPHALRPGNIAPNKYYTPYPPLPVAALAAGVKKEIDTSSYFKTVNSFIGYAKQQKTAKDISLNITDAIADIDKSVKDQYESAVADTLPSRKYTVQNNHYEQSRLQADSSLKEQNDDFSKQVAADDDINIAFDVLSEMKNQ